MSLQFASLIAASAVLVATASPPVAAATVRTFVSGRGADGGTCAITTPCRSFAYAITQTSPGGEILVLDSAGYGPVTITQAVSIVAPPGIEGAVTAPSGATGVTINAGPNDIVTLRGLSIDGAGVGRDGIDFNTGKSVAIEGCHIANLSYAGVSIQPAGATSYSVSDTEIANVASLGLIVQPFNTRANGTLSKLYVHDNNTGLFVGYSNVHIVSSTVVNNRIGIGTENGAAIALGQTTVSENTAYGIQLQGGTLFSYGNNSINLNATDVTGGSLSSFAQR